MSSLTKKLMFFIVFSIQSNFSTSDRFGECMGSVHEVFNGDVSPVKHFKMALYSLSQKLILSNNDTQDYMSYYEENAGAISLYSEYALSVTEKHNETLNNFRSIIQRPVSPNNTPPEIKKQFVLGYFNSLIYHFVNPNPSMDNRALINNSLNTPQTFCLPQGRNEYFGLACVDALYTMLRDPDYPNHIPANMNGYQILKYVYKKITHLDFTLQKYFPETFNAGGNASNFQIFQLGTMASYLGYITDRTQELIDETPQIGIQFPTIESYCIARSST